jgi:hypothetical protein
VVSSRFNRIDQRPFFLGFQNERAGAGRKHGAYQIFIVVHRKNDDFDLLVMFLDLTNDGESVQSAHLEIQYDDIRLVFGGKSHRFDPVRRFGAHLPTFPRLKQRAKTCSQDMVVVGQQDSDLPGFHREPHFGSAS